MSLELPPVGLGTMGVEDPAVIANAIDLGYRHLDTAQIYRNEAVVGEGIARSAVERDDLVVATKVWADSLEPAAVHESTRESLERLGLDRVDLLYVHRPIETYDPPRTLSALEELREAGLIDHIGLSNFTPAAIDTAHECLESPIAAHQVEFHPLYHESDVLDQARAHGFPLVAYSPLVAGRAEELPPVTEIAAARGVHPAVISLAWVLSHEGVVAIPKASSSAHLEANLAAADITLDDSERQRISSLDTTEELFPE